MPKQKLTQPQRDVITRKVIRGHLEIIIKCAKICLNRLEALDK